MQRGKVSHPGVSSQGSRRSRTPFFLRQGPSSPARLRDGGQAVHPPQTPALRVGMLQSIQGDRHSRERDRSGWGRWRGAWEHLDPSNFGSWACSVSLISSWKTSCETPTKAGVRPRPTSCHNRQFAEATAAAPAARAVAPPCQEPLLGALHAGWEIWGCCQPRWPPRLPCLAYNALPALFRHRLPVSPPAPHREKGAYRSTLKTSRRLSPGLWAASRQQPELGCPLRGYF